MFRRAHFVERAVNPTRYLERLLARFGISKTIGGEALYLAFENAAKLLVGFFVSVSTVNYLGPARFGYFSYVLTFVATLMPIAAMGIAGPLLKALVNRPDSSSKLVTSALVLRMGVSIPLFVGLAYLLGVRGAPEGGLGPREQLFVVLILASQFFVQAFDVFETVNQVDGGIRRMARARLVSFAVASAGRLAAIHYHAGLETFALLVVAQLAISFGLMYVTFSSPIRITWSNFSATQLSGMYSAGLLLTLAGFINMAQARCEIFLLQDISGVSAVGLYNAALRILELFDTVGTISVTVYLPRLLRSMTDGRLEDAAIQRAFKFAYLIYLAIFPVIVAMAFASKSLFHKDFTGVQGLILMMSFRPFLALMGLVRGMFLLAEDRFKYGVVCSLVGFCVSLAAAATLIPRFGVYGAATSSILGYVFSNIIMDGFYNRRYFRLMIAATGLK